MSDSELSCGWFPINNQSSDSSDENSDSKDKMCDISIKKELDIDLIVKTEPDVFGESPYRCEAVVENTYDDSNSKVVKAFFENNSNLKIITDVQDNLKFADDDLWLLQCPSNIKIEALLGVKILDHKDKIRIPNTKYECISTGKELNNDIVILEPAGINKPCNINTYKVGGKFIIRERMKSTFDIPNTNNESIDVPFPDDLKVRHPLFGANFKKEIKLSKNVTEKLSHLSKRTLKNSKNEKKQETKPAKHIKRKASINLEKQLDVPKKMKFWESETTIEKHLFDSPISSKKSKK